MPALAAACGNRPHASRAASAPGRRGHRRRRRGAAGRELPMARPPWGQPSCHQLSEASRCSAIFALAIAKACSAVPSWPHANSTAASHPAWHGPGRLCGLCGARHLPGQNGPEPMHHLCRQPLQWKNPLGLERPGPGGFGAPLAGLCLPVPAVGCQGYHFALRTSHFALQSAKAAVATATATATAALDQKPRVTGGASSRRDGLYLPSSHLAMALRCTSSGPSARRSVRAPA